MKTTKNITVTGNTYPAAKLLRSCGFDFDKSNKTWVGTEENRDELNRVSTATYSRANQNLVSKLIITVDEDPFAIFD